MKITRLIPKKSRKNILRLLCVTALSSCSMFSYAQQQQVNLSGNNLPLKVVFQQIEQQTKLSVDYKSKDLNDNRVIKSLPKEGTLDRILELLLDGTNCEPIYRNGHVIIRKKENTIQKKIKGKVIDIAGTSVIGANVVVKGTTNGTITDLDGNFELDVPSGSVLTVSYIGYLDYTVKVTNQELLSITLKEDNKALEEVVVVGYGTQKKVNLTAAVQTVDTHDLENRPVKSLSEMLSASVPGLYVSNATGSPTSEPTLNIRGFTGMSESGAPLVLVDNVRSDIRFVNPNDVKSISVLKDAAASAIYGSSAPNGVILITTKSGKKNSKMSISYDASLQIGQPLGLHKSINSYDYALYRNNLLYNTFKSPVYSEATIEKIKQFVNGEITNANDILPNGKYAGVWETHGNTDNFDIAFKDNVINTKHNLSISGGSDKIDYYAGVGFIKNDGLYNTEVDWMKRYTTLFKVNSQLAKWLKVGTRVNYNRQQSERPRPVGGDSNFYKMLGFHPTLPVYNDNGTYNEFSVLPNIFGDAGTEKATNNNIWLNFNTEVNPIKGLSIKADYTWKLTTDETNASQLMFGGLDADGTFMPSRRSPKSEFIEKAKSSAEYHNANISVSYTRKFGKHNVSGIVGYNEEKNHFDQLYGQSTGIISHSNLSLNTTEGSDVMVKDHLFSWATKGYFGRLSYNYDDRYMIEFSGRYDASSKFSPDTRWSFFPSVSAAYNIAREKFWIFKDVINKLKLKASIGKLGNNYGNNYSYIPTLGIGSKYPVIIGNERPKYVTMPSIISPSLTWTKPRTIGFGFETGLFQNRLEIEYDWYQRTVYDQIGPALQVSEVLGTQPPRQNNSVSETRGWELSVKWRDQLCTLGDSPVNYSIRAGVSDYIGYVVSYESGNSGLRSAWTPGQRFGELYGYKGLGIGKTAEEIAQHPFLKGGWNFQGDYMFADLNGDGLVNQGEGNLWYADGDRKFLGYTYPRYRYNINLTADWKGLSFSVLLDGVGSQKRYVANRMTMGNDAYLSPDYLELGGYWNLNNPNAFFPRCYANYQLAPTSIAEANDKYVFDLGHLRVKNIFLSYTLPTELIQHLGLSSVSVNCSVENLCLIYNKSWNKNLDPIHILNDCQNYPPQRIWSFGLKLSL